MRQLGVGQTLCVYVVEEVEKLMKQVLEREEDDTSEELAVSVRALGGGGGGQLATAIHARPLLISRAHRSPNNVEKECVVAFAPLVLTTTPPPPPQVLAWLTIQTIKTEATQATALALQDVRATWRRRAFDYLHHTRSPSSTYAVVGQANGFHSRFENAYGNVVLESAHPYPRQGGFD